MKKQAKKITEKLFENNFLVSTKIACDFFGISRETLSTWVDKGAPKEARGKYDLKKLHEWRYKGENMETPATRKLKAEADFKEAKAKQEKIKLSVTEQKFLPVAEVQDEITKLLLNLKKALLSIGHNVATELAAKVDAETAENARGEVDKRIKEALEELSKNGRYTGKRRAKTTKKKRAV